MKSSCLLMNLDDPEIAVLTLNRPEKRNALSLELIEALSEAVVAAHTDRRRRAIVLAGAGPVFCAGLDLHEAASASGPERSAEGLAKLYEVLCLSPLVTIAAAQGAAIGGGAGLISACDFVVAADDLRIGFPEVHRGLVAALVTCLLSRQLTDRQTRELVLLGQTVSAERALSLGLVSRVVPVETTQGVAMNLAREACRGAPGAVERTKRLLNDLAPRPMAEQLQIALACHLAARHSDEAAEGIAAFREKREPRWPLRAE